MSRFHFRCSRGDNDRPNGCGFIFIVDANGRELLRQLKGLPRCPLCAGYVLPVVMGQHGPESTD